jgi:hypothetical protein
LLFISESELTLQRAGEQRVILDQGERLFPAG